MTYVITQPCVGLKDGSCVDVCPVDCIHPAEGEPGYEDVQQLFINPDECIDCGSCANLCAHDAIYSEADLPADKAHFAEKNRAHFQ